MKIVKNEKITISLMKNETKMKKMMKTETKLKRENRKTIGNENEKMRNENENSELQNKNITSKMSIYCHYRTQLPAVS